MFLEILGQDSLLSSMLERHIRKTSIHNLWWLLYTSYTSNNCFPKISFCQLMSQHCVFRNGLVSVGYLPKEDATLWFEVGLGIGERWDASSIYISVTNERSRKLLTQTFQIAVLLISKELYKSRYLKILADLAVGMDRNWALNIESDIHFLSLKSQMCSVNSATGTAVIGHSNLLKLSEAIPTSYWHFKACRKCFKLHRQANVEEVTMIDLSLLSTMEYSAVEKDQSTSCDAVFSHSNLTNSWWI